ncbi:MAG: FAD-binding protein [Deltaproteobacteria bacterium]|nr:FAD-binding protein [Deltaproteobacteria bacterium]MBI4373993.1 FAD-binding protein [Deltaproteobacteria bacterium]
MTSHVTIIGSGIAAVAAAIAASSSGAKVTVIGGRAGATALYSGAWDIAADPTRYPGKPWEEMTPPQTSLQELGRRGPTHPYNLISRNEKVPDLATFLNQAIRQVERELAYRLHGSLEKNFLIPSPLGTVKATAFVGPTHDGNILEMRGARLLIIGIRELPFPSRLMGTLLKEQITRQPTPFCSDIKIREISMKRLSGGTGLMELALKLDEEGLSDRLHESLLEEAEKFRATHILLPPVIGVRRTQHIFSKLKETKNVVWFESLGIPPSIPGLRLHHHIEAYLKNGGVNFIEGEGVRAAAKNRRVVSLTCEKGSGITEEIPVDRLILATGKFIGGGLSGPPLKESLLNLPLLPPSPSLEPHFFGNHKLFATGLRVGPLLQPVDSSGRLAYENLWAAGSIIGGYQPITEGCGMGVALGTGTLSGRLATDA